MNNLTPRCKELAARVAEIMGGYVIRFPDGKGGDKIEWPRLADCLAFLRGRGYVYNLYSPREETSRYRIDVWRQGGFSNIVRFGDTSLEAAYEAVIATEDWLRMEEESDDA